MRGLAFGTLLVLGACSEPADVEQQTEADHVAEAAGANLARQAQEPEPDVVATPIDASCKAGEQAIFACTMKSGKLASICVAGEGEEQFAQYRFGPAGKPTELVWPATSEDGQLALKTVPYSGGGEAQISFARGDTTYVVFSRVIRTNFGPGEPNNPAFEDGIMILRGGAALGELRCENEADPAVDVRLAAKLTVPAEELYTP